jgi:predicted small lipoprotein YifL
MRRRGAFRAAAALAALAACGRERPPAEAPTPPDTAQGSTAYPTLPDTLVLTAPGGVQVWYSGARRDADSLGAACLVRGLVLVRDSTRTLVPLLMTGVPPEVVNDTTMRARIWLHCRPGNTYDINLRTGTPTRIR